MEALAKSITENCKNDYEKAQALVDYFEQNGYVYDNEYEPDDESIAYFLFTSKRGNCTNYATSMTLMARMLGLPARYVEGFAAYEKNEEDVPGYAAALRIIKACVKAETIDQLPDEVMDEFFTIEGVQERVYESIVILEAVLDEIRVGKAEQIESLALTETFDRLDKVSKLLSTSLFIDLDKVSRKTETADHAYITAKKEALVKELGDLFSSVKRPVYRSMMCKLLAAMPIFMNTQQEIRDYFDYVIENCKDDSELMACNKLISEMIEE